MVRERLTVFCVGVLRPMTNPRTEAGSYIQGRESFTWPTLPQSHWSGFHQPPATHHHYSAAHWITIPLSHDNAIPHHCNDTSWYAPISLWIKDHTRGMLPLTIYPEMDYSWWKILQPSRKLASSCNSPRHNCTIWIPTKRNPLEGWIVSASCQGKTRTTDNKGADSLWSLPLGVDFWLLITCFSFLLWYMFLALVLLLYFPFYGYIWCGPFIPTFPLFHNSMKAAHDSSSIPMTSYSLCLGLVTFPTQPFALVLFLMYIALLGNY